jgi:hypothetical protein
MPRFCTASRVLLLLMLALMVPTAAQAFPARTEVEVISTGQFGVVQPLQHSGRDVVALSASSTVQTVARCDLRLKLDPPTAVTAVTPASALTNEAFALDGSASTCAAARCTYAWDDVTSGVVPLASTQNATTSFSTAGTSRSGLPSRTSAAGSPRTPKP